MHLQRENHTTNIVKIAPSSNLNSRSKSDERLNESLDPPALSLDERGMIQDCTKSFEQLFGFKRTELVWQHVSRLFPQLDGIELVQAGKINSHLQYISRCGRNYLTQNRQGDMFFANLCFVRVEYNGRHSLRLIVNPSKEAEA
jgi:PAS domain S-box-containing protein